MKNYIHKIARDNIKKNSKFYKYIFASIFLTFFTVIFVTILFLSLDKAAYNQRAYYHGQWDVVIADSSKELDEYIQSETDCSLVGKLFVAGEVIFDDQNVGYIGRYDENGLELANLHLLKGRFARNDNEVVVEKNIYELMKLQLNQKIGLNYQYEDVMKFKEFNVVGIIDDYTNQWTSRGLSFITTSIESYNYDLLLKGKTSILLWNHFRGIDTLDIGESISVINTNNYPYYIYNASAGRYINESSLLKNVVQIIVISFIAVISTMISSLNKRESQFVLLRSIGMTFKQLQRLIIYESIILLIIGFILAGMTGLISSLIVMGLYSLINQVSFAWTIDFTVLFIELSIAVIIVIIGIFLPTLTIYDLPLARKNGEYIYHPKKKKIRKLNLKYFIKNELSKNKVLAIFIFIMISGVLFNMFNVIDAHQYFVEERYHIETKEYISDFIWNDYEPIDVTPLLNDDDIHVYKSMYNEHRYLRWDDMDKENSTIIGLRNGDVIGNLVCIDNDDQLKDYLYEKGYIHDLKLDDNEAIVVIPNHNYKMSAGNDDDINKNYIVDIVRQEDGNYADDIGLAVNKEIQVIIDYNNEIYKPLKIKEVIRFKEEVVRDYFNEYTVIVNKETYLMFNSEFDNVDNYIAVNVDSETARNKVQGFFNSMIIKHKMWQYDGRLFNSYLDRSNQLYSLKTEYSNTIVYNIVLAIIFLALIFMMRLLLSYKLKKDIGLLRSIGMTKKRIYFIHFVYATLLFVLSLGFVFIGYMLVKDVSIVNLYNLLMIILIYGLYIMIMLIPLRNILEQKPLDLIQKAE